MDDNRIKTEMLFSDREPDYNVAIADYATFTCEVEESKIYGQIMWPDGSIPKPRPCVIMWHGYAGAARNDDIAHALCRAGLVVIVPHHRGAWGSGGKYSFTNCVEDAIAVGEKVRDPEFAGKYDIDPANVFLFGHSVGSATIIGAAKKLPWLRGLILMTPFDPTAYIAQLGDENSRYYKFLESNYIVRGDGVAALIKDVTDHAKELRFESGYDSIKDMNLLLLTGTEDIVAPAKDHIDGIWKKLSAYDELQKLENPTKMPVHERKDMYGAHGLIGVRVGATLHIARFIDEVIDK